MNQWLYKKGKEPKQFKSKEASEDAQNNGWVDTPAKFNNENVSKVSKASGFDEASRDELYEIAKSKGINVPSNVGKAKLIERLEALQA